MKYDPYQEQVPLPHLKTFYNSTSALTHQAFNSAVIWPSPPWLLQAEHAGYSGAATWLVSWPLQKWAPAACLAIWDADRLEHCLNLVAGKVPRK